MKVRLSCDFSVPSEMGRLKRNVVYTVLAVEAYPNGKVKYRFESDDAPVPLLFPAEAFEILSSKIPSTWCIDFVPDVGMSFQPGKWSEDGFWEDFFNDDEEATRIYVEERDRILNED